MGFKVPPLMVDTVVPRVESCALVTICVDFYIMSLCPYGFLVVLWFPPNLKSSTLSWPNLSVIV